MGQRGHMNICWFTTGKDNEAVVLFKDVSRAVEDGAIDGAISLLFLNREEHESEYSDMIITEARQRSIPVRTLSTKRFLREHDLSLSAGRGLFDAHVHEILRQFEVDIVFLAGYLLIVSPVIFSSFPVLNVHPSLPGEYKGRWEDVINRTIDDRKKVFGVMIHLVDEILNAGPPVAFARMPLKEKEIADLYERAGTGDGAARVRLFNAVRGKEFEVERPLIIQTLSYMSKGVIEIRNGSVLYKGKPVPGGVDITEHLRKRREG